MGEKKEKNVLYVSFTLLLENVESWKCGQSCLSVVAEFFCHFFTPLP